MNKEEKRDERVRGKKNEAERMRRIVDARCGGRELQPTTGSNDSGIRALDQRLRLTRGHLSNDAVD